MYSSNKAIRAKTIITLANEQPAVGKDLFRPLQKIDNGLIIFENGIITEITTYNRQVPPAAPLTDLGDVCVIPPVANCHTHLQLSWLRGRTIPGQGFGRWLQSLIKELLPVATDSQNDFWLPPLQQVFSDLAEYGTGFVGDVGGTIPGALTAINQLAKEYDIKITNFCEWFGFQPAPDSPWPIRCVDEITPEIFAVSQPSAHALYSTSPDLFKHAYKFCQENNKIFSFHLAESDEENELLESGKGMIYELYKDKVLPLNWHPYQLRPTALARKLNILGPKTLAVHGCQLNEEEIKILAERDVTLCLCPRSNRFINVGEAPVKKLINSGVPLCLGTDGLSSNTDLDVRADAQYLQENLDIPFQCLIRMLTINGANALGFSPTLATLAVGHKARFSVLPIAMMD